MNNSRNYPLLLASQFLGALGDNMILAVILGQLTFKFRAGQISEQALGSANAIYTSLLFIPYFLLAPLAGYLNDRYAKTRWLLGGNAIKLLGTSIGAAGLAMGYDCQAAGYFIVGIGSCLYSPAKYGILPEILPASRLVKANGTVEMLTLVAILAGNIAGSKIIDHLPALTCYAILLAIFGLSTALNVAMVRTPNDPSVQLRRSVGEFCSHGVSLISSPRLGRVLMGTTLFWICGAVMKMNFQPFGLKTLQLPDNTAIALLGLWLSIGVMIGSLLAGQLHEVGDLRATRRYGIGLAVFVTALGVSGFIPALLAMKVQIPVLGPQVLPIVLLLIGAGILAGVFLIPLNAALQAESDPEKLGKTIATQNFLENLAMSCGGALVLVATKSGATAPHIFLGLAALLVLAITFLRFPPRAEAQPQPTP
jgi:LPLT family lysophospholipid transporter-like MFS transporter